jgi:hypothetical protein
VLKSATSNAPVHYMIVVVGGRASALAVGAPEDFWPELLPAAHRPVYGVPVRRDFLQRASRCHGGRLKPLDYLLDFRQAPLDVKELAPDGLQFLREDLVLAALAAFAHDAGRV